MQINRTASTFNILKTVCICLALLILVLFFSDAVSEIFGIVFGGCIIAFLLMPFCRLMEKKFPRTIAALLAIIGVSLALTALLLLLTPMLLRQLSALIQLLPEALLRLRTLAESLIERIRYTLPGFSLPKFNFSGTESQLSQIAMSAAESVRSFADKIYRLFLMASLSYFLMSDRERILLRMELLVPGKARKLAVRAGNMFLREMRLYLRGQATISLSIAILATSALTIIGVPGSPLLGILVGIFNVIPYLGPFLGGIPAVILALSISWQKAAFTLLALFLVQQIDGMVISPRVMGNITGFSPAVVLLAIFVGARLGNITGMLFALPSLMAIRTVYRVFVQRHENN